MMSPFPGMDPYLEDPVLWPGVHNSIIYCLRTALNRELPPNYVANIEERLYVSATERQIVPDLTVLRNSVRQPAKHGGAAVLDKVTAPRILTVWDEDQRETYIQVQEAGESGRVVTVIEVLSYANKSSDSEGHRLYLQKQREVLDSPVHLMEIDLLRAGRHTVAAPLGPMEIKFQKWDYLVCLSRSSNRHQFELWPLSLRKRLPRILVPLKTGDQDVAVDLQAVMNRVYDEGAYIRNVNYEHAPSTPLRREDEVWASRLLRKKGLRAEQ